MSDSNTHKKKRSTQITDFFLASRTTTTSLTTKRSKTTHRRSSSSVSTLPNRSNALPVNRTAFFGRFSSKSTIPKYTKQNVFSRRYGKLPANRKYNQTTTMATASTGLGHIKAAQDLGKKIEETTRYYETRTVIPTKGAINQPATFQRSKINVSMRTANHWPTWTICLFAMDFTNIGNHYTENIGYHHKSTIDLVKTTTKFLYKTTSNQAWKRRIIVWTHPDFNEFNRCTDVSGNGQTIGEHELLPFVGTLTGNYTTRRAIIAWQETYFNNEVENNVDRRIDYLLEAPLHTKYPSTPFYWGTTASVGVLYDATDTIPSKEHHLDSGIYLDDTWQQGPGLIEYNDRIERGGNVLGQWDKIKHNKNTYMTVIWEPEGRHSGESLPREEATGLDNSLSIDVIHTIHWRE